MKKSNIKIMIIVLLIIFCVMLYLILSSYNNDNKKNNDIKSYEYSKNWKITAKDNCYEMYINDNNAETGSYVYLLDKDDNLIYKIENYRININLYVTYYDISSTSKVIITKDKIRYNKDKSKKLKYIGPTTSSKSSNENKTITKKVGGSTIKNNGY